MLFERRCKFLIVVFLVAGTPLSVCVPSAYAQTVTVRNNRWERFNPTATVKATPATVAKLDDRVLVEYPQTPGGPASRVPFAIDARTDPEQPLLTFVLPGVVAPGEVRTLRFAATDKAPVAAALDTDLEVEETADAIVVRNTYFELQHPRKGGGGFPGHVRFRLSGTQDDAVFFLDRLFSRQGHRQFMAKNDARATARIVFRSPARTVVEARTGYVGPGGYAPGNIRAVYRYVYTPFSPVVEVQCRIERDDDRLWNELHFLHLSREDFYYTRFITGDPPKVVPMLSPGTKSRGTSGRTWAVMATDEQAVGVGFRNGVVCWDAANEFVYYVRAGTGSWNSRTARFRGRLYFGLAPADLSRLSRRLGRDREMQVTITEDEAPAAVPEALTGACELRNEALRIVFADAKQGFDCLGIEALAGKRSVRFVFPREDGPGLWRLELRTPAGARLPRSAPADDKEIVRLTNRSGGKRTLRREPAGDGGAELTLTWAGIDLPGEPGAVDVTVRVKLPPGTAPSTWRIQTTVRSRRFGLWETCFPTLSGVIRPGEGDALLPGGNWGMKLVRNNRGGGSPTYPSTGSPMQFMAFMRGGLGLYLAAHDGEARPKRLVVTSHQDTEFATPAENMGVPGASTAAPFPVVIAGYQGDWWQAARIYRAWALKQVWTRKGPIVGRKDVAPMFKDLGLWFLLGGRPDQVQPVLLDAQKRLPFPIGVHWYNWHKIPFDNSYPEYFPTKPGFAKAAHDLTGRGQVVMPYINGRLWDRDIPSFKRTGLAGACKDPKGEPYTEIYGSGRRLAPMCPTTNVWQNKVHEIVRRLFTESGVNAVYLDQIGAAAPRLCFDPSHGHALGGGAWWTAGYRRLLDRVRAEAVAVDGALTTENDAEPYMDNIDGFLIWNPRFDTDVPAMTAVYSGYTTYFSTPEAASDDLDAFVAAQGRDILWGCQPGWNGNWLLDASHKPALDFLTRMVRYRLAAKEFFVYGHLEDEVRPLAPAPSVTVTWHRRTPHSATLPAVLGTIWTSPDRRVGVFLLNIDNRPREISWRFEPGRFLPGVTPTHGWLVSRLTPDGRTPADRVPAGGATRSDVLLPHEVLALVAESAPADAAAVENRAAKSAGDTKVPSLLRRAAEAFVFEQTVAASGVRIAPETILVQCARDEAAPLAVNVANSGGKPCKVRVRWPDGATESRLIAGGTKATLRYAWTVTPAAGLDWVTGPLRVTAEIADRSVRRTWRAAVVLSPPVAVRISAPARVRAGEDLLLPVEVSNMSRTVRSGRIELRLPKGWSAEPGAGWELGSLTPGARRTFLVHCRVPERSTPGRGRIEARFITPLGAAEVEVLPARPRWRCVRFKKAPKIDGRLDEWKTAPPVTVGADRPATVKIEKKYGGDADCSAQIRAGWDDKAFYFAAVVRDNCFFQDQQGRSIWQGDAIQLAFHRWPPNRKTGYDGSEIEIGLTRTESGPYVFRWGPDEGVVREARLAVRRTQDGRTVYEAAIPWAAMNLPAPTPGARLAASFTVNDNDGKGFRGWLEWTPGICGGKDSSSFGRIDFVTQP
ncbi:MAG: hypothetical protein GXP31_06310 [Kiritimatiellaeota bacterium]|nr:hypothetical protein [Kiritimatiellota bacterium]